MATPCGNNSNNNTTRNINTIDNHTMNTRNTSSTTTTNNNNNNSDNYNDRFIHANVISVIELLVLSLSRLVVVPLSSWPLLSLP